MKRHIERLAGLDLELECLENLDETIDSLFDYLKREGKPEQLEDLCPYFGVVWPSARALTEYLASFQTPQAWRDKAVLEVGCGLAIPSLYCAKMQAKVTATDCHPEVPNFLERNCELNGIRELKYLQLDWRHALPSGLFDWVIASDVLYEKHQPRCLAKVIAEHLAPGGKAIVADPARPYLQAFADEMKELGFRYETIIKTAADQLGAPKEIFVLIFSRA